MRGRRGWPAYRHWIAIAGLGVLAGSFAASAQAGANAGASAQARAKIANPKVQADRDAGLLGETPLDSPEVPDPTDISVEGSPLGAARPGVWIRANTPLSIRLTEAVSSGIQRNGDTLAAVLMEPVKASDGTVLKPGTPVKATVLSAARAGQMQSGGVLSLQVFQVGGLPVISNVLEFDGQEGKREVADANPEKGTEAMVQSGSVLKFQVLGSGDRPEPEAGVGGSGGSPTGGPTGSQTGAGSVSHAPSAVNQPAPGSTPLTPIHGMTQPHV